MRLDLIHEIDVADNPEVKTPSIVHASLPEVAAVVVFLCVERRMMQVLEQELRLLVECFLGLLLVLWNSS
jgi:hypothetical protein